MPVTKSKLARSEFTSDVWAMRMWLLVRARLAMRSAVSLTKINIFSLMLRLTGRL